MNFVEMTLFMVLFSRDGVSEILVFSGEQLQNCFVPFAFSRQFLCVCSC